MITPLITEESLLSHTVQRLQVPDNPFIVETQAERDIKLALLKSDANHTIEGRFAPGNCANPLGRPKAESTLPTCTRAELERIDEKTGLTNAQVIARQLVAKAKAGDTKMIEMAFDYITGKPVQSIQAQFAGVQQIIVRYEDKTTIEQ